MILVTVGTHEQPFDRLVRAAGALEGTERLVVQYGTSHVPHGRGEWVDFMSFDELADLARDARAIVCHAGVGSIVLARRFGRRPIVMPRRPQFGEHVDEHQMSLARRLESAGLVTLVEDEDQLIAAVVAPATEALAASRTLSGPTDLSSDVRGILEDLGAARISPRAAA